MRKFKDETILLIYQDCPDCGRYAKWWEEQLGIAKEHGLKIEKISFVVKGAEDLAREAPRRGLSYPFFTDGQKFSKNLQDFVSKHEKSAKTAKNKEKVEDGNSAEG